MNTVPVQFSKLQMSTLDFNREAPIRMLATETLQQGYQQALTTQQAQAPVLTNTVNGPGVYPGADGHLYLVPAVRLTYRANLPRTPEIASPRMEPVGRFFCHCNCIVPKARTPQLFLC